MPTALHNVLWTACIVLSLSTQSFSADIKDLVHGDNARITIIGEGALDAVIDQSPRTVLPFLDDLTIDTRVRYYLGLKLCDVNGLSNKEYLHLRGRLFNILRKRSVASAAVCLVEWYRSLPPEMADDDAYGALIADGWTISPTFFKTYIAINHKNGRRSGTSLLSDAVTNSFRK